jgi:hypothetical protein
MHGPIPQNTKDQTLWVAIRNRTRAIAFDRYSNFLNRTLGAEQSRSDTYELLRLATDDFLKKESGIAPGDPGIELIWSYWHEEGMLVQTIDAVTRRFQNIGAPVGPDPLSHLDIDPLRPLNNLLWGFIQDEPRRLTVKRRAYEYDHHYGLTLSGKAAAHTPSADSRSQFSAAFDNLLHLSATFLKDDDDTTVIADGLPLLRALKDVHLLLAAEGTHNQFGDLPWTARAEMLQQQWILAKPEIRDFLKSQTKISYEESWMSQVDTMKKLQGWSDVSITHFHNLGVYGEQVLLPVRYGDWTMTNNEDAAKNWARYWRPEIQGYVHATRAVTGVDLTA